MISLVAGCALLAGPALAQDAETTADIISKLTESVPLAPLPLREGDQAPSRADALTTFKQRDLAGTWHVHIWVNGSFAFWVFCTAKVKATGKIAAGGKCRLWNSIENEELPATVSGGTLKISKAGKVTGKLLIGSGQIPIRDGWMERSKDYFQTVGVNGTLPTEISAVKR